MQTPKVSRHAGEEFEADVTSVTLPHAELALSSALSALATGGLAVKPRGGPPDVPLAADRRGIVVSCGAAPAAR